MRKYKVTYYGSGEPGKFTVKELKLGCLWAGPGGSHRAFDTVAEAEAWIDELIAREKYNKDKTVFSWK